MLCENPMEGGFGYLPSEVGELTLDQVFFLLTDRKNLSRKPGGSRTASVTPVAGMALRKGRAADGTLIQARVTGKSLARRLMEEEAEKKLKEVEEKKVESWKEKRRKRRQRKKETLQ